MKSCRAIVCALLVFGSGCASVPFDYPKSHSEALPPDPETAMGAVVADWRSHHGEQAGLVGLSSGLDALGARLRMLEQAQKSVDAQYFILKKDRAGELFAAGLLGAADRGVKVRLLVDDIFSPGVDEAFTLLSSHPNIEIRIFNPLSRSGKYLNYLTDFSRVNRRMHNKSFTVDNSMSIVGGRNIGEEYFEINQDVKFDDYEVLVMGAVVEDISRGFDKFWNSDLSVPIEAFEIDVDLEDLNRWRTEIQVRLKNQADSLYATALNSKLLADIRSGAIEPVAAEVSLYTDTPDKLQSKMGDRDHAVLAVELARRFRAASKEIIIVTPYYVPRSGGAEFVEELLARGIRVIIVTNSLASTNHVAVHSGYSRYRKRLLKAGAEFYEVRADSPTDENEWGHAPEMMTLHSKATVIDRESIFVGSLNFDPRSIYINTEMGIFIDSPEVGALFTERLAEELGKVTWQVDLDDKGKLRWTYDAGGETILSTKEPGTSWWRRFQVGLYKLLPIEGQL
jgi:putative cardiolipin synthase